MWSLERTFRLPREFWASQSVGIWRTRQTIRHRERNTGGLGTELKQRFCSRNRLVRLILTLQIHLPGVGVWSTGAESGASLCQCWGRESMVWTLSSYRRWWQQFPPRLHVREGLLFHREAQWDWRLGWQKWESMYSHSCLGGSLLPTGHHASLMVVPQSMPFSPVFKK